MSSTIMNNTELLDATWREDQEEIRRLISEGHDPKEVNYYGETCLHLAVFTGNLDVVRLVYTEASRNVGTNYGCTALQIAEEHRLLDIVDFLNNQ